MKFRRFGTTADVGVISGGRDIKEAFEAQAAGMFSVMVDLRGVRERLSFGVEANGDDDEGLLVAWLNELLFLSETRSVFLRRFVIGSLSRGRLKATAFGEEADPARHVLKTPVKAVTYHGLSVAKRPGGVTTRVVYDI